MTRRSLLRTTSSWTSWATLGLSLLVLIACTPEATDGDVDPDARPVAASASTPMAAGDTAASPADEFVLPIEAAHGADAWWQHEAVEATVTVEFGGQTVFAGTMVFPTDLATSRVAMADGETVAVFDGTDAWVAGGELPRARFHLLTWPYFLAAPMKLQDPGTDLEPLGELPLGLDDEGETLYPAARLTFDAGVGDTPDDWYVVYRDPQTDRLVAMGYIVTYGTAVDQAEAAPHAIVYDGWETVDGVQIPTAWSFYDWSRDEGIRGEPIGRARLENVRFTEAPDQAFAAPEGANEDRLPETPAAATTETSEASAS